MMPDPRLAIVAIARPVVAGHVFTGRIGSTLRRGAGQNVVSVRHGKRPWNDAATLIKRGLRGDAMVKVVEAFQIRSNPVAVWVEPRTGADPVPGVDGVITLGAQIRTPGQMPLIDALCQVLADLIRSFQTTQVTAVAGALTGDKEGHWPGRRLRLGQACKEETTDRYAVQHELIIAMHD